MFKAERVRDPVHNLIEFRGEEFESILWRVVKTRPFQRLRRIKQQGFSDFVYPGATHSRFIHSLGVFHTARRLMEIVEAHLGSARFVPSKAQTALAAALLHDLGHGPFSHAFEDVGKKLNLKMARHENVSDALIRSGEVAEVLSSLGSGFANDVADMIGQDAPSSIYGAVFSSQFDADRLDYIRRDRMMTGTHLAMIDFEWLIANLEVGEVQHGVDAESVGTLETFVLGPKAIYAAESYVLGLFQLYPTVYFHKTTRAAEKIFSELVLRVITACREGKHATVNLSKTHPLALFAADPDTVENVLPLDDAVLWGAIHQWCDAGDVTVKELAVRLRDRKLFKAVDVRGLVRDELKVAPDRKKRRMSEQMIEEVTDVVCDKIEAKLNRRAKNKGEMPRFLFDRVEREPYRRLQESKGQLNQIMIRLDDRKLVDIVNVSKSIRALKTFKLCRVYVDEADKDARDWIKEERHC